MVTAQTFFALRWHRFIWLLPALVLVAVVPAYLHQQIITGSLINATLLATAVLVGPVEAILLGFIPSLAALSTGLLPLPLAPTVPYIMVSNALYIAAFSGIYRKHFAWVWLAPLIKFSFLYLAATYWLVPLLPAVLLPKAALMLGYIQLLTASIGLTLAARWLALKKR